MEISGRRRSGRSGEEEKWVLRLYVAGATVHSVKAVENLKKMCREHISGEYDIEIIDLLKNPEEAATDHIFAIPTLVRIQPSPSRKIIGDLSNTTRVLNGLDIK